MTSKREESELSAKKKRECLNAHWLDTWFPEIAAVVFSAACFLALCVILAVYDGKTRPRLHFGLTLNAIISILATGCKSSIMFAIGEALSQMKWVWFRHAAQPLIDIQAFDSASRGPLGSTNFLFQGKQPLASFGAVLILFMLAFDPFIQQITTYSTRSAAITDDMGVAKTRRLKAFATDNIASEFEWDMAYRSGLWSNDNIYQPQCPTGNCTWPAFRSVGICSKCTDITPSTIFSCHEDPPLDGTWDEVVQSYYYNATCRIQPQQGDPQFAKVQWRNMVHKNPGIQSILFDKHLSWIVNVELNDTSSYGSEYYLDNKTFSGIKNPLVVFGHAEIEYDRDRLMSSSFTEGLSLKNSTQCAITPCVSNWEVAVNKGNVFLRVSDIDYGKIEIKKFNADRPYQSPCWIPNSAASNVSFDDTTTNYSGYSTLGSVEFAFCELDKMKPSYEIFTGASSKFYDHENGDRTFATGGWGDAQTERIGGVGLERIMHELANALNKMALNSIGEDMNGTAYDIEVYVSVHWPWLTLPAFMFIAGVIFLALAMVSNRGTVLWKSSVLAYMYHAPSDIVRNECATTSQMEKEAMKLNVQLRASHGRESRLEIDNDQETQL